MQRQPNRFPPPAARREDSQSPPEVAAPGWVARRLTGGRPMLVARGRGRPRPVPDCFALLEELANLEEAMQSEVGHYRLYPVDQTIGD